MGKAFARKDGKANKITWVKDRWKLGQAKRAGPQLLAAAKLVVAAAASQKALTPEMNAAILATREAMVEAEGS